MGRLQSIYALAGRGGVSTRDQEEGERKEERRGEERRGEKRRGEESDRETWRSAWADSCCVLLSVQWKT